MARFGTKLRIKRLAMGLSLKEVSKKTKIKQKHLMDLEEEDILRFSDKEKIIELTRVYAAMLNLDCTELLSDFEKLWSDSGTANMYMQNKHNNRRRFNIFGSHKLAAPAAVVAVLMLILLSGSYLYWNNTGHPGGEEGFYTAAVGETGSTVPGSDPVLPAGQDQPEEKTPLNGAIEQDDGLTAPVEAEGALNGLIETGDDENLNGANENGQGSDEPNGDAEDGPDKGLLSATADDGLPRTSGIASMFRSGILAILSGLVLFTAALLCRNSYDSVLGPPY